MMAMTIIIIMSVVRLTGQDMFITGEVAKTMFRGRYACARS